MRGRKYEILVTKKSLILVSSMISFTADYADVVRLKVKDETEAHSHQSRGNGEDYALTAVVISSHHTFLSQMPGPRGDQEAIYLLTCH